MRPAISLLLVLLAVTAGAGEIPDVLVDQDGPFWWPLQAVVQRLAITP